MFGRCRQATALVSSAIKWGARCLSPIHGTAIWKFLSPMNTAVEGIDCIYWLKPASSVSSGRTLLTSDCAS